MPDPNNVLIPGAGPDGRDLVLLCPCRSGNTTLKMGVWRALYGVPDDEISHYHPKDWHIHASRGRFEHYISPREVNRNEQVVIGLIREPYARALSMWGFSRTELSFEDWLASLEPDGPGLDQHQRSQACDLTWDAEVLPNIVLYLEDIENDWRALCLMMQWPETPLPTYRNSLEERDIVRRAQPEWVYGRGRARSEMRFVADFLLYYYALRELKASTIWDSFQRTRVLLPSPSSEVH